MKNAEWNPGLLLATSSSYWQACTLHAGVKLGIFSAIGQNESDSQCVADKLGIDEEATFRLLTALTAMGLLVKRDALYSNTAFSAAYLVKESPKYIGYLIMHHHYLMESWSMLDQSIRTGQPVRKRMSRESEEKRESFLMGMFNSAMASAPQIAERLDLANCQSVLDLGGGPGTYAIHFCLKNPTLRATVADLPTTRPFAEKTIERFGLTDRISFMDFDYLEDAIEERYDAVWLSHILHSEGPDDCRKILGKSIAALRPGGVIAVHEFILDDTMDGPLFAALFSLNMLLGTTGGRSYSEQQLKEMLVAFGVKEVKRLPYKGPTDSGILCGRI